MGEQSNSTGGSARGLHFAAVGPGGQDEFRPETLSSGLPAGTGAFVSSSTEYLIEQSQLLLCYISFPTSFLITPIIYYYYDWLMPSCKGFSLPCCGSLQVLQTVVGNTP